MAQISLKPIYLVSKSQINLTRWQSDTLCIIRLMQKTNFVLKLAQKGKTQGNKRSSSMAAYITCIQHSSSDLCLEYANTAWIRQTKQITANWSESRGKLQGSAQKSTAEKKALSPGY